MPFKIMLRLWSEHYFSLILYSDFESAVLLSNNIAVLFFR